MKGLDFLAAAYTAIWLIIFVYLLSLARRASRLERELDELHRSDHSSNRRV
jgi:CcmD family protein